jgi:predicted AAA+ superfamily ATPase
LRSSEQNCGKSGYAEGAVDKDLLKRIIIEGHELIQRTEIIKRSIFVEPQANHVFVGIRRAGKTFLMFQEIKQMLTSGHALREVLYINFEDERLLEMQAKDLEQLTEAHLELFGLQPIYCLDEIQNIAGWEKFARRLVDAGFKVYITGSNAQMLSREIATTLGGRFIIDEVYPFSFAEFLRINGVVLEQNWQYSAQKSIVRRIFDEYLSCGGFAEAATIVDRRQWTTNLYQKILFGDVLARHHIRNDNALRLMVKKLAESVGDRISYNRLTNIVKSVGVNTNISSVIDYLGYLDEAYLIFSASNLHSKLSERESARKYYFADNGLLRLFTTGSTAQELENLVALELKRRYGEVIFAKDEYEMDFIVMQTSTALQVCYSTENPKTSERELRALADSIKKGLAEKALILTMDEEAVLDVDGLTVTCLPVWKWLLEGV